MQFEQLLIRAGRLKAEQQVGCFVSGLQEGIKLDVQAAKPATLTVAIGLARLYEAHSQPEERSHKIQKTLLQVQSEKATCR